MYNEFVKSVATYEWFYQAELLYTCRQFQHIIFPCPDYFVNKIHVNWFSVITNLLGKVVGVLPKATLGCRWLMPPLIHRSSRNGDGTHLSGKKKLMFLHQLNIKIYIVSEIPLDKETIQYT